MNRTTITIPAPLRERARDLDINVSRVCREALRLELLRKRRRPSVAAFRQVAA